MTAHPTPARRRLRRAVAGLVVALCALALAACGADVSTTMTLGTGTQGSRVISLTLGSSDLDSYVTGGAAAIDASITKHKPPQIEYSGIATTATGISTTFTIPFSSADDYRSRVAALLTASGSGITPQITLAANDSLFTKGAAIEENFTSKDLLGWLVTGLVDDGVVTSGNSGSFWNSDANAVVYGGETTSLSSPISFERMQDNGITAIAMVTTVQPDGKYARTITYSMDAAAYATNPSGFDDYFTKATPQGGTLSPVTTSGGSASWSIELPAGDAAAVVSMTNQALGSSATQFSLDSAPSAATPTLIDNTLVDSAECSAICSPQAAPITSTVVVPSAWQPISGTYNVGETQATTGTYEHAPDGSPVVFEYAVPLASIAVDTVISPSRAVTETFTFSAANADADRVGDGFQRVLKPADGVGSFTTNRGSDTTTYVVVISGTDATDFATTLRKYLPQSDFVLGNGDGNGFFHDHYDVYQQLGIATTLASSGVTNGYTYTLSVPARHTASVVGSGAGTADRTARTTSPTELASLEYDVSGLPTGALVFWCVLAGVVVLALAAAFLLRRRIGRAAHGMAERIRQAGVRAAERRASPVLAAPAAVVAPPVPASGPAWVPPAPGPDEVAQLSSTPEFSEADLV